ncbi:hypothetical protein [Streptomyces sp. NPDC090021]|uniref:hypothetical protein n=1 Tax=Streptomyces sp. NPDC090021 TaxID=3365919 RepID=UPI00381B06E4
MDRRTARTAAGCLLALLGAVPLSLLAAPPAAASCGSITYEGAPGPAPATPALPPAPPSHDCASTAPQSAAAVAIAAALATAVAYGVRLYRAGAATGTAGLDTDWVIGVLALQGHGPQRHLFPDTAALKARKGRPKFHDGDRSNPKLRNSGHVSTKLHVDPACDKGTCVREVRLNGGTKKHSCGDYATKFHHAADFVRAEEFLRERALNTGIGDPEASIEEIFGPGDHSGRFEGYYVDPANPLDADESVNLLPVDFRDGYITAFYEHTPDGFTLTTMYPSPHPGRHP